MSTSRRKIQVKSVRGPVVSVPSHRQAANSTDALVAWVKSRKKQKPLAVDLFCGAGGLSIGLRDAGYDVILGVDNDPIALETYAGLHPGLTLCRDMADPSTVNDVVDALSDLDIELIAGGPPCQPFSRAGMSKIRSLVQAGMRPAQDARRDLWRTFLDVVLRVRPRAVLLENVPDMATAPDTTIVRALVAGLEDHGYAVHTAVLSAGDYGVPQLRQRFLMVALADRLEFDWPRSRQSQVTVADAIGDLPPVEAGWRPTNGAAGYVDYKPEVEQSKFSRRARRSLRSTMKNRVYDHITRPVRDDDREIFRSMTSSTRYSDIEDSLKRYRDDIFDDKYKRLDWNRPSRSITAHIARDGYWYIHPEQDRTLTVREAARLQTFPDHVRFAGPPSAAFKQIGNAVPPRLAEHVARSIRYSLSQPVRIAVTSTTVSRSLRKWLGQNEVRLLPWLESDTTWSAIQAHLLLDRASAALVAAAWPTLAKLDSPKRTIEAADQLRDLATLIGRSGRVERVFDAARWCLEHPNALTDAETLKGAPYAGERLAHIAALIDPTNGPTPTVVSRATLRVASRVFDLPDLQNSPNNRGKLAISRLLGGSSARQGDNSRRAMVAVLELASQLCKRKHPICSECPLRANCVWNSQRNHPPNPHE